MVKSIKYIFTRVLIGVGIAILLMIIKGNFLMTVNALEGSIGDGSTSYDCTGNTVCDINLGESFKGWDKGYLQFNVSIYDFTWTGSTAYPSIQLGNVYVTVGSKNISCEHTGSSGPRDYQSNTGTGNPYYPNYSYSVKCYVDPKTNGINSLHLRALGYIGSNMNYRVWTPLTYHTSDSAAITNAIEDNTDSQDETNSILGDNDVSNSTNTTINGLLETQDSQTTFGPVADLIMLPLTLFRAFYNSFDGTCSNVNLGTLFNHQITLPCINLQAVFGSSLYNIIDVAISLFMIYNIILMCIDIFDRLTSLEDPFNELYTPNHAYHPKHGKGGGY